MLDELSKRIVREASAIASRGEAVTASAVARAAGLAVADVAQRMRALATMGQLP